MTTSNRDRLTAMVLRAMRYGMKDRVYPGGRAQLLSDTFMAWGIPTSAANLRNRTCPKFLRDHHHVIGESSLSVAPTPKVNDN